MKTKAGLWVAFLLWAWVLLSGAAYAGNDTARILFINSYHRGYKWSDDIEGALLDNLKRPGVTLELSIEYLDSRRFEAEARMERVAAALETKFHKYPLDLVILADNAAFDFAVRYRDRLFPSVPIVFCGYNQLRPEAVKGLSNITGVNEEIDFSGAVDLALTLLPRTTTLAFITSTGELSSARIVEVLEKTVFPKYRERYEVVAIRDASVAEIRDRLARLPPTSVVFLSGQTRDLGDGRALTPVENGRLITPISPFPVFSFWDFHLGTGVLGGRLLTGTDQGREAARLALKILAGFRADDLPLVMESPTTDFIDYPVLERFGIDPDRIPSGAVVLNRPFSLWENYRWQIIAILTLLGIETLLIASLVVAVRQRRAANTALTRLNEELELRVEKRTEDLSRSNQSLERLNQEVNAKNQVLENALLEIRTLRGFLPICAHCKKIRDDQGYWNQIEKYIQAHSEAVFSHGICPDCMRELYPDIVDKVLSRS